MNKMLADSPVWSLWILRGEDLPKADFMGKSDPYVVVIYNGQEVGQTTVKYKTLDPTWNEGPWPLPLPAQILKDTALDAFGNPWSLVLEVWDKDLFGKDFMGQVTVTPKELVQVLVVRQGKEIGVDLAPKPNMSKKDAQIRPKGKLFFRINPPGGEDLDDEVPAVSAQLSELLVDLMAVDEDLEHAGPARKLRRLVGAARGSGMTDEDLFNFFDADGDENITREEFGTA